MRRSLVRHRVLAAALAACPVWAIGSSVLAGNDVWIGSNGYWSNPGEWGLGYAPTPSDNANFDPISGIVVSFNASAPANTINVSGGNVQFNLSGQTVTLGASGNAFIVVGTSVSPVPNVIVDGGTINITTPSAEIYAGGGTGGGGGNGILTIQDGAVINTSNGYLNAGDNGTAGSGVITVEGAGTTVNVGNVYAGASAIGTLNVSSGATINTGGFTVGAEATGYANVGNGISTSTVNASNGTLALGGFISIDKGQTGLLSINTGGLVIANQTIVWNSNSQIHLAGGYLKTGQLNLSGGSYSRFNWSSGTVELTSSDAQFGQTASPYNTFGSSTYSLVNGESLNVSGSGHEIDVGVNTSGELDLSSGASIAAGHLQLGYSSNGTGTMKMDGATTVSNTAVTYIGLSGSGNLQMTNGATLNGDNMLLGANNGASGTINVSGGSSINLTGTGQLSVGGYIGTSGGSGSLIINGGNVTTPGPTQVWNYGSITINSGTFSGTSVTIGGGTLAQSGGVCTAAALQIDSGSFTQMAGTVTVNGPINVTGGSSSIQSGTLSSASLNISSGTFTMYGGTANPGDVQINVQTSYPSSGGLRLDGGLMNASSVSVANNNANSSLTFQGGTLSTGSLKMSGYLLYFGKIIINGTGSNFGLMEITGGGELDLLGQADPSVQFEMGPSGILRVGPGEGMGISRRAFSGIQLIEESGQALPASQIIVSPSTTPQNRQLVVSPIQTGGISLIDISNNDWDAAPNSQPPGYIYSDIAAGFDGGHWDGSLVTLQNITSRYGVISSSAANDSTHLTAVGVISNFGVYSATNMFDGYAPGVNDTLIKCTYYGDANLDGKVDGSDYSRIDAGFLTHSTNWLNGDFNYDGVVNGSDYTLIDNAFNQQGAAITTELGRSTAEVAGPGAGSAVPEPGMGIGAVMGMAGLLGRRRTVG